MKKHKNVYIILTILLFILIVSTFVISNKLFHNKGNIILDLTYYDDAIPGSKSDINIYNHKVEIVTTHFCSAKDCQESKPLKKTFNYSKENINKLVMFINTNFSKNKDIELYESELNERQKEVIQGLLLGEYFFETNLEEYKYKIEYSKTDNLSYIIYFKKDKSILVKKLKINDDYDIVKVETYSLDFSKENLNILNDYIEKEVKDQNSSIIYKYSTLKKNEENIFKSITENNEAHLKNINNEAKLAYTITYSGINCLTPTLYLYNDSTYEYYYTFSEGDKKLAPKTGTYNYDFTKIINNIDKYENNHIGMFNIKDEKGNNYITYGNNIELQELFKLLNVNVEKCLEQQ